MKVLVTLGILRESRIEVPAGAPKPEAQFQEIDSQAFEIPPGGFAHMTFPIKALALPGINPRTDQVQVRIAPAQDAAPSGNGVKPNRATRRRRPR